MESRQLITLLAGLLLYNHVSDAREVPETLKTVLYNCSNTIRSVSNVDIKCTDYKSALQNFTRNPTSPPSTDRRNANFDLTIRCWDNNPLHIDFSDLEGLDPDVAGVQLEYCNLQETDFGFLAALPSIWYLTIRSSTPTMFQNFPFFPNLQHVGLYDTLLDKWTLQDQTPNTTSFALGNMPAANTLSLLDSLMAYENLASLTLSYNQLDYIPVQVKQFSRLNSFMFMNQMVTLTRGSLDFNVPVTSVDIFDCGLRYIEEGALTGNFSNAYVGLGRNNLERMDEAVFKPILTSMHQVDRFGVIDLGFNPLVCGCDIRWLVQDNRHLLEHLSAKCGEVPIESVNPASLNYCSDLSTTASAPSAGERLKPLLLGFLATAVATLQLVV